MFCFLVFQMVLSSDSTLSSKTDQETGLKFHFPAQIPDRYFQDSIFGQKGRTGFVDLMYCFLSSNPIFPDWP